MPIAGTQASSQPQARLPGEDRHPNRNHASIFLERRKDGPSAGTSGLATSRKGHFRRKHGPSCVPSQEGRGHSGGQGDSAPSGACAGAVCPKPQTWHFPFRAAGRLGIRDLSYPHCHFLSRLHHILHCSGRWSPWLAFGLALSPCPDLQSLCTCTQQVRAPHRRRSSGAARRGL